MTRFALYVAYPGEAGNPGDQPPLPVTGKAVVTLPDAATPDEMLPHAAAAVLQQADRQHPMDGDYIAPVWFFEKWRWWNPLCWWRWWTKETALKRQLEWAFVNEGVFALYQFRTGYVVFDEDETREAPK